MKKFLLGVLTVCIAACTSTTIPHQSSGAIVTYAGDRHSTSSKISSSSTPLTFSFSSKSFSKSVEGISEFANQDVKIPILVYHHIRSTKEYSPVTWSWKMSVSPAEFAMQMQWAEDHGYTSVTLDQVADFFEGKNTLPKKPFVITFDDNQETQLTEALPILLSHHFTAIFYLITNRLDDATGVNASGALLLQKNGMQIGSHTISHAELPMLSEVDRMEELTESKRALEELLHRPILHLAYPLTMQNPTVRESTKNAGYRTGTIMDPRPAKVGDDLFKLPRIMMTDQTDLNHVLP